MAEDPTLMYLHLATMLYVGFQVFFIDMSVKLFIGFLFLEAKPYDNYSKRDISFSFNSNGTAVSTIKVDTKV